MGSKSAATTEQNDPVSSARVTAPAAPDGLTTFLTVGIGASAGGLEAFKRFLTEMPPDSGMAFVLVQHLSPDHKSMMAELLGKTTRMDVIEAGWRPTGRCIASVDDIARAPIAHWP